MKSIKPQVEHCKQMTGLGNNRHMVHTVSLEELVKSGAHFGHQSRRWNPKMAEYLYGEKDGIHIFDLTKTKEKLDEALDFLKQASKEGKTILFLGTKKQAKDKLTEVAKEAKVFYINERWLGGTLSNFEQIKKSVRKLSDLKSGMAKGEFNQNTKKERLLIEREIERLEKLVGGLTGIDKKPDVMVIVDTKKEFSAVREAKRLGVTMVGFVDSNADPTDIDYVVPMNDDASRALEYVLDLMGSAILEGKGKSASNSHKSHESVTKNTNGAATA